MKTVLIAGKQAIVRTGDMKKLKAEESEFETLGKWETIREGALKIIAKAQDVGYFVKYLKKFKAKK